MTIQELVTTFFIPGLTMIKINGNTYLAKQFVGSEEGQLKVKTLKVEENALIIEVDDED